MPRRCSLSVLLCLFLCGAVELNGQGRFGISDPRDSVVGSARTYSEFEEAFRAAAAQAGISPSPQEELLAEFKNNNGRRLVPGQEVRAFLLEKLYERGIPFQVSQAFFSALRQSKIFSQVIDTGFLEAIRQVDLGSLTIRKIGRDGSITPPRAMSRPLPRYTEVARRLGAEGSILLKAVILEDGSPVNLQVLRGLGYGLDEAAILTIQDSWKFEPGLLDGKPVPVEANIEVSFRLY